MEKYGFRGLGEIDVMAPRWQDDPGQLAGMVLNHSESKEKKSHRNHFEKLTETAEKAVENLILESRNSAFSPAGKIRAGKMRRLLGYYRAFMPYREHGKYYLMRHFGLIRKTLLDTAEWLVNENILQSKELIWFVDFNSLINLTEELEENGSISEKRKSEFNGKAASGKANFERAGNLDPPRIMLGNGYIPRPSYSGEGIPEGALAGAGVSAGTAEGPARVITDPSREQLEPGEILVAPFTDPAWTPLFINAAAVVIEVGGRMTHGSVVAREYGIPAVVSIPEALKKIKTGDMLRVNGSAGYVEIIK
jgi:pyruvate,water dikinase